MENNNEYHVKVKNFKWNNYILIIKKEEFILIKEKSNSDKGKVYSLLNALVIDQTGKTEPKILISSPTYKFFIKLSGQAEKKEIMSKLESIIKQNISKTAFSKEYFNHLKEISNKEEKTPYESILFKLNTFKLLMGEIDIQLAKFKTLIKEKLSSSSKSEFQSFNNDMNVIISEMKKQFSKIHKGIKKYFAADGKIVEGSLSSSSESSENYLEKTKNAPKINMITPSNPNINEINKANLNNSITPINKNPELYYLNSQLIDYYNPNYDFRERVKLSKNIKCSENMVKEMITIFTKKLPSPVYFNEPLSMGQKQCEKFFYLDILTKASKQIKDKPLQMCYICAFIIGEIFLNIGRFLKPFNPILGETYEYFENYHKFRYYSEQVKHKPQITAFVGETPDFVIYGDTLGESSFKFLKGIELTFKNKINIYLKNTKSHYKYNRPIVYIKGLMKPPMYNDYSGTTIIQDENDKNTRCELTFLEQSWMSNELGKFEGKAYSKEDEVKYLIGGNWQEEIYITDPEGNNKQVLLCLNKKTTYLKNTMEKYTLPFYSCNLNYMNEGLKKSLPKNDSRFRKDISRLEKGESEINNAQMYKNAYEEKQRCEIKDEGHEILYFNEKKNEETNDIYYVPNGKYWEMKKDGTLKNNKYKDIFEIEEYLRKEKEKEREKEKEKEKEEENKINEAEEKGNEDKKEEKQGKELLKEKIKEKEERDKREKEKANKKKLEKEDKKENK